MVKITAGDCQSTLDSYDSGDGKRTRKTILIWSCKIRQAERVERFCSASSKTRFCVHPAPPTYVQKQFGVEYCNTGVIMAKIAKTADRKKVMDTSKSTDCPKCGKPTRIVKRVKDRERGIPGGVFISCSACDFFEKL
jgi:DNA-directed RNA polymerase subunit M/transcription elongation factor TFIIS